MEDPSHGRMNDNEDEDLETISEDSDTTNIVSGLCQDCTVEYATRRFLHLDGRDFFLCESCYYGADHESDYGEDFPTREYLEELEASYDEDCYEPETSTPNQQ